MVVAATKAPRPFPTPPTPSPKSTASGSATPFASGGSKGYDHKKWGSPRAARGSWVKRHFRELGHDIQTSDFTVVGVGDMSGDVFGNGMLQSRHIRLLGAFNHLHVFVDPDPTRPAVTPNANGCSACRDRAGPITTGRRSRRRGVFDRAAKAIAISPQMQHAFGIAAAH